VAPAYQIPDALWEKVEPILAEVESKKPPKKKPGRPRMENRKALTAILYLLRAGCQWEALPRSLGAKSTVHDRLEEWREAGVFKKIWKLALEHYDGEEGIEWEWQALDGAMTKAPLGGEKHRQEPDGPGEAGREAVPVDGRQGHPAGCGGRGGEPARLQAGAGDPGQPGAGAARL
jgi:putative transposase